MGKRKKWHTTHRISDTASSRLCVVRLDTRFEQFQYWKAGSMDHDRSVVMNGLAG
jgi:hypothetical protein